MEMWNKWTTKEYWTMNADVVDEVAKEMEQFLNPESLGPIGHLIPMDDSSLQLSGQQLVDPEKDLGESQKDVLSGSWLAEQIEG